MIGGFGPGGTLPFTTSGRDTNGGQDPGMTTAGQYGAQVSNGYRNFGYQRDLAGQQNAAQQNLANTAATAQMYPATLAQGRFNQIFPYVQSKLNQFDPNGFAAQGVGGASPQINSNGVWSPQQVQAQVNQANAGVAASTAAQGQQASNQLAGRGFGANSPLLQALQAQFAGQGMQQQAANRTNIQGNAAQMNAQQRLAGQTAAANQYNQVQQQQIQRQGLGLGYNQALLGTLASLMQ